MQKKTIQEIEEEYDLELERIIRTIKREKAKRIMLQFPDGLKPYATTIIDYLQEKMKNVEFFIWLGSCFGACDVPSLGITEKDFDLIVQFGHSPWDYNKKFGIKIVR